MQPRRNILCCIAVNVCATNQFQGPKVTACCDQGENEQDGLFFRTGLTSLNCR